MLMLITHTLLVLCLALQFTEKWKVGTIAGLVVVIFNILCFIVVKLHIPSKKDRERELTEEEVKARDEVLGIHMASNKINIELQKPKCATTKYACDKRSSDGRCNKAKPTAGGLGGIGCKKGKIYKKPDIKRRKK